ncbi:MAG: hypothetical protein IPM29_17840 [Planctomycetes bacterium]|nr:hypothetical protein [Planctomycetota bacterium]
MRARGEQANEALRRCRDYVRGWLAHADPETGLIPRNLSDGRGYWNGRDAAADNYPFMVLTAAWTDRALFEGRMLDMLRTETRLTSRVGALPDDWSFATRSFRHAEVDLDRLVFDGSEYVKDGLMPLTEWLGPSPWSERMLAIVDSILEHAPIDTPYGRIPSTNGEVNGEMMQVLGRLSFMTGEQGYLEAAARIADHYLLEPGHHPSRDADRLPLRDHGCELISGLTEVYLACRFRTPERAAAWREPLRGLLDRVLEIGRNEHGLFYNLVDPRSGRVLRGGLSDNWGYDLNGFYTVWLLDGTESYRDAARLAMSNLLPHYLAYPWEGSGADGIADSVEGAINLSQREQVAGVDEWIDANIARMFAIQRPDGIVEGWHGDGNFARTALMWAAAKQQGASLQPWRADLVLGAARDGPALDLLLESDWDWSGALRFDAPRHRTVMHLPLDYPRINQFPEWFTIDAGRRYTVTSTGTAPRELSGTELLAGLPVALRAHRALRLRVVPAGG